MSVCGTIRPGQYLDLDNASTTLQVLATGHLPAWRFYHAPLSGGNPNGNRFAPLQTPDNPRSGGGNGIQEGSSSPQATPFQLDKAAVVIDLSSERPQWILSAYGPGRHAPAQLFGGPLREQSFEEMRLMHYVGAASGNPQEAVQEAEKLVQAAEQQIQTALHNVDSAIDFIVKSQNEHPNRVDIVRESQYGGVQPSHFGDSTPSRHTQTSNPFGAPVKPPRTSNPFVAPSQTTQTSNPFGAPSQPSNNPAVGAPSHPGAFGQPSALGQKPNPFGGPSTPAFGGPSQLGGFGGAFARPSALGQKPNPFGTPSGSTTSGPTAPAAFSAFSGPSNPFSQPPVTTVPNPFGAPVQTAPSNPFSNPPPSKAWGVPSGQDPSRHQQPNPFGGASTALFGVPSPGLKTPFSTTSQPPAPKAFGVTPAQSQANLFGATLPNPNPSGGPTPNPPANANPFGKSPPGGQTANPNPFGNPPPGGHSNPFGQTSSSSGLNGTPIGGSAGSSSSAPLPAGQPPPLSSYSSRDASGRLTMFNGKRVEYKDDQPGVVNRDGSWTKIWYPDGPPKANKDTEMKDSEYDEKMKEAYMYLRQHGSFEGGVMPLLPPKREWCLWDF